MKSFLNLTKTGIITFVLLGGLAGYALSFPVGHVIEIWHPIMLLLGLYFLSAGSFSINQAQEWQIDKKMKRTEKRPVASGTMAPWQAYALGLIFCSFGMLSLFLVSEMAAYVGLATVVLYNGFYTLHWKKKWAFGAVPGAIPGALPVVIGFAANNPNILHPTCIYLFLVMFLWQMPHFWCIAIKYKDDYARGGIPVLPVKLGQAKTLYHIGLYTIAYAGLAISAPIFVKANVLYLFLVIPFAIKVVLEFFKYYSKDQNKAWLSFFMWVNFSLLAFIASPVFDKWLYYWLA